MTQKLHTVRETTIETKSINMDGICPFTEEPSVDRFETNKTENENDMDGDVLFSIFTANIINEKIVFTR